MKAIDCFQVFSRVYSQDFNKFFLKTQVNIPKKFSICRLFNCKPKKEKKSFPITIALDRVVLRHTDTGINIVIQYCNMLMKHFKFLDIIFVARYLIKNVSNIRGEKPTYLNSPRKNTKNVKQDTQLNSIKRSLTVKSIRKTQINDFLEFKKIYSRFSGKSVQNITDNKQLIHQTYKKMATGKSKQSSHFNHDASDQKNESKSIP